MQLSAYLHKREKSLIRVSDTPRIDAPKHPDSHRTACGIPCHRTPLPPIPAAVVDHGTSHARSTKTDTSQPFTMSDDPRDHSPNTIRTQQDGCISHSPHDSHMTHLTRSFHHDQPRPSTEPVRWCTSPTGVQRRSYAEDYAARLPWHLAAPSPSPPKKKPNGTPA
ncbi:hypothetical protein L210DRAFT_3004616 [Boletus edulis BED1]|uniref:Uncharacterized protein n=1 Tax=Boletus edulis BED1 TaxID=1328754 RepID=A0AAD4BHH1_BOLED|nr:hypothetical protein L210DRAFT_3004616 [Boletus edulis BED1]